MGGGGVECCIYGCSASVIVCIAGNMIRVAVSRYGFNTVCS